MTDYEYGCSEENDDGQEEFQTEPKRPDRESGYARQEIAPDFRLLPEAPARGNAMSSDYFTVKGTDAVTFSHAISMEP